VGVRDVWSAAVRLRHGHDQHKRRHWQYRQTERFRGGGEIDLHRNRTPGIFLMIGNRAGARRDGLMAREMRVERPAVMVSRLHIVEMHVRQRRGNRARLHEDDEGRGGQPAKHGGIVVNDRVEGT
jgi:hypothetical protein